MLNFASCQEIRSVENSNQRAWVLLILIEYILHFLVRDICVATIMVDLKRGGQCVIENGFPLFYRLFVAL